MLHAVILVTRCILCSCIVSLNGDDYVEETCAKYYPATQGASVHTSNGVDVTLTRLVTSEHVTRRQLRLTSDALPQPHDVCQLQLQSWKMYDQVRLKMLCRPIALHGKFVAVLCTMQCHLPYGIVRRYLPSDTGERTPP